MLITFLSAILLFSSCNQATENISTEKATELTQNQDTSYSVNTKQIIAEELFIKGRNSYLISENKNAIAFLDSALQYDSLNGEAYYYRALAKASLKEYKPALLDLEKAETISPKEISIFYYKALLNISLQDFDEALINMDKAVELNPDNGIAYSKRGTIRFMCEHTEEACLDWTKAIELGYSEAKELKQEYCK